LRWFCPYSILVLVLDLVLALVALRDRTLAVPRLL
jgi:hypothetical protein